MILFTGTPIFSQTVSKAGVYRLQHCTGFSDSSTAHVAETHLNWPSLIPSLYMWFVSPGGLVDHKEVLLHSGAGLVNGLLQEGESHQHQERSQVC